MDDLDDVFAQKTLCDGDDWSCFAAENRSVIAIALVRLLKTVPLSKYDFPNLVTTLVDELQASQTSSINLIRDVKRQNRLVSEFKKSKKNALNNVASLRARVAAVGTR